MVVQTECIQRYEASSSRKLHTSEDIPPPQYQEQCREERVQTKLSSRRHDHSSGCALSMGRQVLGTLSIGMSVRRLEHRSSFANLKLAGSPVLGAFYSHHTPHVVRCIFALCLVIPAALLLPLHRYAPPFASKTST